MSVTTAEVGSVMVPRRPRARSVLALAWLEAGRMLRHPAFLIGVGATVLAVRTVRPTSGRATAGSSTPRSGSSWP